MRRLVIGLLAALMLPVLCACDSAWAYSLEDEQADIISTEGGKVLPTSARETKEKLTLPEAQEGWAESYIDFIDDNYDIFAALWPEGLTGVGFIDLDLDGTPEMVVFDLGASATMGVQMFDIVEDKVQCVSSVLEDAAGAFGDEYFSKISVCASYFEAFRLSYTDEGYCFWVDSANGTLESSWDEIIRFDCKDGVLTPVCICSRYLESDVETGLVVAERYRVADKKSDPAGYAAEAAKYTDAEDMGYDAAGVFLWSDMSRYDTTYDGLMAMARDAAKQYVPIEG